MSAGKNKCKKIVLAAAATVAAVFGLSTARPASAVLVNLQDNNSTVQINTSGPNLVNSWVVSGSQMMSQASQGGESFYYALGNSGQSPITSLGISGAPNTQNVDGDSQPGNDYVSQNYANTTLHAQLVYQLIGGAIGTGTSQLGDSIKVTNFSAVTQTLHLYEYSDFVLGGSGTGPETATISGANSSAIVSNPSNFSVTETMRSTQPNYYQVGAYPNLFNTISNPTVSASPLNTAWPNATTLTTTNADATYAYEWDAILAPGFSLSVGLQKNVTVPEPASTVALIGLGGLFLTRSRRRDEDPDPRTQQVAEA